MVFTTCSIGRLFHQPPTSSFLDPERHTGVWITVPCHIATILSTLSSFCVWAAKRSWQGSVSELMQQRKVGETNKMLFFFPWLTFIRVIHFYTSSSVSHSSFHPLHNRDNWSSSKGGCGYAKVMSTTTHHTCQSLDAKIFKSLKAH